uniref:AlNc14C80G5271 protein n=2 Tax=Albugo laibachii Nc14 TaxID=890382 RepID=F0WF78_9STRA|nr:AlNc14C80G5271 [Albugo laibachii Nc14]|eukprot:CCA19860.1 AlNc14C80G5271 [Albugo laibachii Nc14]
MASITSDFETFSYTEACRKDTCTLVKYVAMNCGSTHFIAKKIKRLPNSKHIAFKSYEALVGKGSQVCERSEEKMFDRHQTGFNRLSSGSIPLLCIRIVQYEALGIALVHTGSYITHDVCDVWCATQHVMKQDIACCRLINQRSLLFRCNAQMQSTDFNKRI